MGAIVAVVVCVVVFVTVVIVVVVIPGVIAMESALDPRRTLLKLSGSLRSCRRKAMPK